MATLTWYSFSSRWLRWPNAEQRVIKVESKPVFHLSLRVTALGGTLLEASFEPCSVPTSSYLLLIVTW